MVHRKEHRKILVTIKEIQQKPCGKNWKKRGRGRKQNNVVIYSNF